MGLAWLQDPVLFGGRFLSFAVAHSQNGLALPNAHEVVDGIDDSAGNFSLCTVDGDVLLALQDIYARQLPGQAIFDGGAVACGAGVSTIVFNIGAPVHDLSTYRFVVARVDNTGANPFADCRGYVVDAAGNYPSTGWISTTSVASASAGHYRSSYQQYVANEWVADRVNPAYLRVNVISVLGTTVRCRVYAWR